MIKENESRERIDHSRREIILILIFLRQQKGKVEYKPKITTREMKAKN